LILLIMLILIMLIIIILIIINNNNNNNDNDINYNNYNINNDQSEVLNDPPNLSLYNHDDHYTSNSNPNNNDGSLRRKSPRIQNSQNTSSTVSSPCQSQNSVHNNNRGNRSFKSPRALQQHTPSNREYPRTQLQLASKPHKRIRVGNTDAIFTYFTHLPTNPPPTISTSVHHNSDPPNLITTNRLHHDPQGSPQYSPLHYPIPVTHNHNGPPPRCSPGTPGGRSGQGWTTHHSVLTIIPVILRYTTLSSLSAHWVPHGNS
jgi:hypothetical protein